MNTNPNSTACDLASVIATEELDQRKSRVADRRAESQAEMELTQQLAKAPREFFQKLADTVLKLTPANSAGISLLDEVKGRFVWPAVAGGLVPYLGEGTPRGFGPCGTVLDQDAPILFRRPERHFTYLDVIEPPLEEVLLIPFHVDEKPVGTIWAVIHDRVNQFQAEDRRLLENLSTFASSAYKVLSSVGAIQPLLEPKP